MCGVRREDDSKLVIPITMASTPPSTNKGSPIQVINYCTSLKNNWPLYDARTLVVNMCAGVLEHSTRRNVWPL